MFQFKLQRIWENIRIPLVALVILLIYLQVRSCTRRAVLDHNTTLVAVRDTVARVEDINNREHAQINSLTADLATVRLLYANLLSSKANELKVKDAKIQSITNFSTSRKVSLDSLIEMFAKRDTVKDNGKITYVYRTRDVVVPMRDSLSITQYMKKRGWFRKPLLMIDVISYEPTVTVAAIQGFQVRQYQNNLNFGVTLSCVPTPNGIRFLPGIGLQYSVFGVYIGKRR